MWTISSIVVGWVVSLVAVVVWVGGRYGPGGSPVARAVRSAPACLTVTVESVWPRFIGQGSGFVLTADGRCVTNHHVLRGMVDGLVRLGDGRIYSIIAVDAYDEELDLAVFRIGRWTRAGTLLTPEGLPAVKLGSSRVRVGDRVAAVSSPAGLPTTMGEGVVSAIRPYEKLTAIQISIPTSSGSSGGPVFDGRGRVVAVLMSRVVGGENLTFAVPMDSLVRLLDRRADIPLASFGHRTAAREAESDEDRRVGHLIDEGNELMREGKVEEAEARYLSGCALEPAAKAPLFNAALCAQIRGDDDRARSLIARLVPLLDEFDDDRWWMEELLAEDGGEPTEATRRTSR